MNNHTLLLELLLSGFFAVACIRTCIPSGADNKLAVGDIFRLPNRLDRLRRSRWQWFSMVALLLVFRVQHQLPLALEFLVAFEFVVFLVLPGASQARIEKVRRG